MLVKNIDVMIGEKKMNEYDILLKNIKGKMPRLEELLESVSNLSYEDRIYRYYRKSPKVYHLQELTEEIAKVLSDICPHDREPFCDEFQSVYNDGTGWEYEKEHLREWLKITRPIVEAFLHAKYFLEMAVKYGKRFDKAPLNMPSGWAALSKLYRVKI